MSSFTTGSDAAPPCAYAHLSGPECDLIAAAAARLPGAYRTQAGPGAGLFAWCSVNPERELLGAPAFSFCRYGTMVALLVRDSMGHKTVVASNDLQGAINAMLAAVGTHIGSVSTSLH